jgi:hypothetical protein
MKDPKHISEIIPEAVDAMVGGRNVHERWQDAMARLELDSERNSMEEFRKYVDSKRDSNLVPTPKLGTVFYCGTGGVVDHEAIRIFENPDTGKKYPLSEEEYMSIIKSGEWIKS